MILPTNITQLSLYDMYRDAFDDNRYFFNLSIKEKDFFETLAEYINELEKMIDLSEST